MRFNIETKVTPTSGATTDAERFARAVVDAVRAAKMSERVTVQSFDWRTLVRSRGSRPNCHCVPDDRLGG